MRIRFVKDCQSIRVSMADKVVSYNRMKSSILDAHLLNLLPDTVPFFSNQFLYSQSRLVHPHRKVLPRWEATGAKAASTFQAASPKRSLESRVQTYLEVEFEVSLAEIHFQRLAPPGHILTAYICRR